MLSSEIMVKMQELRDLVTEVNEIAIDLSWDHDYDVKKIDEGCALILTVCDEAKRREAQVDDVEVAWDLALDEDDERWQAEEAKLQEEYEQTEGAEKRHPIG